MFERFTASARATVLRAYEEAAQAGHDHIGTEHVVVALAADTGVAGAVLRESGVSVDALRRALLGPDSDGDGLDAEALRSIGIDLHDVRRSVEDTFGPGALDDAGPAAEGRRRWGSGHLRFTRRAKKSLERGLRQALMLGDSHIASQHLLLGVLDAGEGRGIRLLRRAGVDLGALRTATVERSRRSA